MRYHVWATVLLLLPLLWAGNALAQLAEVEQQAMSDTFQYALENNSTDQAADWVNPDTARAGAVVPVRTFSNARGQPCREFITTITVGGKQQQGYGTACRQADGTWQIVSDQKPVQVIRVVKRPVYVYRPAARYYAYPHAYYNPYRIYFSFSWLFHNGRLHIGSHYPGVSLRYHPYFRHSHKHYKHRHYAPLPHRRWYRRDHIHRGWHRHHRPSLHRYHQKHHNRHTYDRDIYRDRSHIKRHIHLDRSRRDRGIYRDRGPIERRIHSDRARIERRIHRGDIRSERRIHSDRLRNERRIHPDRSRIERRTFRDGDRGARRQQMNRSQGRRQMPGR